MYLWVVTCVFHSLTPTHSSPPLTPSFSACCHLCNIYPFFPLSLCWLSILLTAKSSILLPGREAISITKSLLCEGSWGSQLTCTSLPDADLSSSYCMCHPQKRTNLNKKGHVSLLQLQMKFLGVDLEVAMVHFFTNMLDLVTHLRWCKKTEREACIL